MLFEDANAVNDLIASSATLLRGPAVGLAGPALAKAVK